MTQRMNEWREWMNSIPGAEERRQGCCLVFKTEAAIRNTSSQAPHETHWVKLGFLRRFPDDPCALYSFRSTIHDSVAVCFPPSSSVLCGSSAKPRLGTSFFHLHKPYASGAGSIKWNHVWQSKPLTNVGCSLIVLLPSWISEA
jgi:hypothetical protein